MRILLKSNFFWFCFCFKKLLHLYLCPRLTIQSPQVFCLRSLEIVDSQFLFLLLFIPYRLILLSFFLCRFSTEVPATHFLWILQCFNYWAYSITASQNYMGLCSYGHGLTAHFPPELQVSAGHREEHLIIWPLRSTRSSPGLVEQREQLKWMDRQKDGKTERRALNLSNWPCNVGHRIERFDIVRQVKPEKKNDITIIYIY